MCGGVYVCVCLLVEGFVSLGDAQPLSATLTSSHYYNNNTTSKDCNTLLCTPILPRESLPSQKSAPLRCVTLPPPALRVP